MAEFAEVETGLNTRNVSYTPNLTVRNIPYQPLLIKSLLWRRANAWNVSHTPNLTAKNILYQPFLIKSLFWRRTNTRNVSYTPNLTVKNIPYQPLLIKSLLWRRANARNVSYTPNPTGEKHTISTFVGQIHVQWIITTGYKQLNIMPIILLYSVFVLEHTDHYKLYSAKAKCGTR